MVNWWGVALLLILAFVVYRIVQKITRIAIKVLTFLVVLVVLYLILTNFGII